MEMRKTLQNTDHLTIRQGEVSEIVTDENNNIVGAKTTSGALYHCKAIVLCTGTLFKSQMLNRRDDHSYRSEWTSGSQPSDSVAHRSWN